MDSARRTTDQQISAMRREFAADYDQLGGSMSAHLAEYLADFVDEEGRVTESAFQGRRWTEMRGQLADEVYGTNRAAMADTNRVMDDVRRITSEGSPSVSTVPHPSIDMRRDIRWNEQKVEAAARSGIGSTPAEAGERMRRVADMNSNATARRVRTAVNGAENAGRMDAMLAKGGSKRWITMADELVRDSHAELHGMVVPVDEEFPNGLMFPGDPSGPPEEVYNCRCSLEWVDDGGDVEDVEPQNYAWEDGDGGYEVFDFASAKWNDDGTTKPYPEAYYSGRTRVEAVNRMSYEEANERAVGFDWWNDRVSRDEQKVITSYRNSSVAINGQLRAGEVTSANASKIRKMEHALDQSEVGVPFICQREASSALLGLDRQATVEDIRNMVGQTVTDKGFMSCVPTSHQGYSFSHGSKYKGMGADSSNVVQYHMKIPEGEGIGGLTSTHTSVANEFILNRGSTFEVVGAYEVDGVVHCNLQYVGRQVDDLVIKKKSRK